MAASLVRDFALDADGDIATDGGDFSTVEKEAAVLQGIRIRVLTFLGEIWLDRSLGVDYLNQILIKGPDPLVVRELVRQAIADTPDVLEVVAANLVGPDANRKASIRYKVRTTFSAKPVEDSVNLP